MSSLEPLDRAREAALGHLSRLLLWVYFPGSMFLFAADWWNILEQPLLFAAYLVIPALGLLVRPAPSRPLAQRGRIAVVGLAFLTSAVLLKAGPRNPSVALSIVMTFSLATLFGGEEELKRWGLLLGATSILGVVLRGTGVVQQSVLPPQTLADDLVRMIAGLAACVFVGGILRSTLAIYRESQSAERAANQARLDAEREAQRLQRQELVVTMARGMAHDLANVIQVVTASLGLMRDSKRDEDRRRVAADAEEVTKRATRTLRALLAVGRLSSSEDGCTDVAALFTRLEPLLRPVMGKRIRVEMHCGAAARVKMAPDRLEQVLLNLAFNARDAMPEGGTLTLGAQPECDQSDPEAPARWVRITVADSGMGVPDVLLPRIFDPFFTTKSPDQGTGLGLAIVARAVEDAGGRIDVSSRSGEGTTFTLRLPLV